MAIDIPVRQPQNIFETYTGNEKALNEVKKGQLENKFAPLEMGIKAQNALSYNNRMGNIGLFLRGISQLPVAERQAYLAVPENRTNYNNMLETFRSGINNPAASGNFLTPEFIRSFGIGAPSNNAMQQIPQATGGVFSKNQEFGAVNQASPQEVEAIANRGNGSDQEPVNNQPLAQDDAAPVNPKTLSPQQRDLYSAQMQTNNQRVDSQLKNRADAAVAFESYLQNQRPELSQAFTDAFKYNSIKGRGQNWLAKFRKDQPDQYANYMFAKKTARELIGNGVRFLENMGQSHQAQEMANDMVALIDKWDLSPETSMKVFNKTMRSLAGVSDGVLASAEPSYPGVRRKLAGVDKFEGDYIAPSNNNAVDSGKPDKKAWAANKPATNEKEVEGQMAPQGTKWMIRPDGLKVPVHESNKALAKNKYHFRDA